MAGIFRIFRGIDVTGIGEDTDVIRDAVFETAAHIAEAMARMSVPISCTSAGKNIRSQIYRTDRVAQEEVSRCGPFPSVRVIVLGSANDVLLNTNTYIFCEEVVDTNSSAPTGTSTFGKNACAESVKLEFLISEFAFLRSNNGFEGFS